MTALCKVDFHCHTIYSKDCLISPEKIVRMAHKRGLSHLVITDHNTIAGGRAARALDPQLIILGEEIKTTHGELLAVYVDEEIPAGLSPHEAIMRLRDQGAFISVSHPFDSWRSGAWKLEDLLEIVPMIDAIEIFNARCSSLKENQRAMEFARAHNLPGTAGSDAHAAFEVGAALLELPPFDGPEALRKVISSARLHGKLSPFYVHFFSFYARWKKMKAK